MKLKKVGTTYEFEVDGSIGEGSTLFNQDCKDATRIVINGEKMTYINSIGVKNWILWNMRLPGTAEFVLTHAPLVMINQASTVVGFMPPKGRVESFNAPYVCPKCNAEQMLLLSEGKHYVYAAGGQASQLNLPEVPCPKCKTTMEPDFLEAKAFAFLDRKAG